MSEAQTIPAKYIFLDVVSFTHNRSVEAQTDIVHSLNAIVDTSVTELEIDRESLIFLPTGDGLCIVLLNIEKPFDIHIQIALKIIQQVQELNDVTADDMRKFQVRIGINANIDNVVTDINGRKNIAGEGVNMAARVMSKADGNQILIGETVYETLRSRERYMSSFKPYNAEVKHGRQMKVYQYVAADKMGLSTNPPKAFEPKIQEEVRLTELVAYYFANSIKNEDFIAKHIGSGQNNYDLTVILWFLSKDSYGYAKSTRFSPYMPEIYGEGEKDLEEVYSYYHSVNFDVICTLAIFISGELRRYNSYFEGNAYIIVNKLGREKLKTEFPKIWADFELGDN